MSKDDDLRYDELLLAMQDVEDLLLGGDVAGAMALLAYILHGEGEEP